MADSEPGDPDPIDAARLRRLLEVAGATSWRRVDVVAEAGSTNSDLAAAARAGAEPGSVLVTGYQSAGRGRLDRRWVAPPGANLALSALVRPSRPVGEWTWIPLLTGLATATAIRELTGLDARLKWPNDVEVGGAKLSGILAELVEAPSGAVCVIGVGVNVHLERDQLPVPSATSLTLASGRPAPARAALAAALLLALDRELNDWESGTDPIPRYRRMCDTLGRVVRVQRWDDVLEGRAADVDARGCLLVDTERGRAVCHAGDVVHVR